jgi:hypothetical protein
LHFRGFFENLAIATDVLPSGRHIAKTIAAALLSFLAANCKLARLVLCGIVSEHTASGGRG